MEPSPTTHPESRRKDVLGRLLAWSPILPNQVSRSSRRNSRHPCAFLATDEHQKRDGLADVLKEDSRAGPASRMTSTSGFLREGLSGLVWVWAAQKRAWLGSILLGRALPTRATGRVGSWKPRAERKLYYQPKKIKSMGVVGNGKDL